MPSLFSISFAMGNGNRSLWQNLLTLLPLGVFLTFMLLSVGTFDGVYGQWEGDLSYQKVGSQKDIDARDNKLYRRPPTYLIIASKIVRPSTVYKVCGFNESVIGSWKCFYNITNMFALHIKWTNCLLVSGCSEFIRRC